ncbi:MAG: hypothetical protein JWN04_3243 [Myxococcaceae bacterium]|nr:hypothetical protein [Myxococcaceae bacterium]
MRTVMCSVHQTHGWCEMTPAAVASPLPWCPTLAGRASGEPMPPRQGRRGSHQRPRLSCERRLVGLDLEGPRVLASLAEISPCDLEQHDEQRLANARATQEPLPAVAVALGDVTRLRACWAVLCPTSLTKVAANLTESRTNLHRRSSWRSVVQHGAAGSRREARVDRELDAKVGVAAVRWAMS